MLHKREFLTSHAEVRTGMTAYDRSGERLGVIENIDDDGITIEKGRIFHRDVHVPYDNIEDVRADDVIIREGKEKLGEEREEWKEPDESRKSTSEAELKVAPRTREEERGGYGRETEEARIPVREEELEAQKREREGEVRVRKDVTTETQRFEVPVQKEEVRVEHVPGSEARMAEMDEKAFQEEEVRIPVREEEVEVTKRPVVKDEVRVSKEARTEEQEVSGEVRKENVKVDRTAPKEKK